MADIVIRNVIPGGAGGTGQVDVAVSHGLIEAIGAIPASAGGTQIDGRGRVLMPGAIDMHVHLRDPGACHKEDIASGTMAAVLAGITTVVDMPNNLPPVTSARAFLDKVALVERKAACDVRLFMALTPGNLDDIRAVMGHPMFAGVKVFLGATTGNMLCGIDTVSRAAAALDCLFVFHAESNALLSSTASESRPGKSAVDHLRLRPASAAAASVTEIASVHRPGMRFHVCHVSTAEELAIIRATPGITCEAAPHHMALDAGATTVLANLGKMNPPLRAASDRAAVLDALLRGQIDCVATDHAPHTLAEKLEPYPMAPAGVPGVDTMVPWVLSLVQDGQLTLDAACRLMSTNPARILGLTDRGRIAEGLRADLFLWDPESAWVVSDADIRSKCGWTPFRGMRLAGRPQVVFLGGRLVASAS